MQKAYVITHVLIKATDFALGWRETLLFPPNSSMFVSLSSLSVFLFLQVVASWKPRMDLSNYLYFIDKKIAIREIGHLENNNIKISKDQNVCNYVFLFSLPLSWFLFPVEQFSILNIYYTFQLLFFQVLTLGRHNVCTSKADFFHSQVISTYWVLQLSTVV